TNAYRYSLTYLDVLTQIVSPPSPYCLPVTSRLISQQVTRSVGGPKLGAPVIGGHVDIGAGAKILGGVKIGDHAQIGANAVMLEDVPGGATAVGVPARIVRSRNLIVSHDEIAETESGAYGSSLMHDTTDQPAC